MLCLRRLCFGALRLKSLCLKAWTDCAFGATVPVGAAFFAIISVGADEHPPAAIVGDDLVEIGIVCAAQRARRVVAVARERMILEIERGLLGMRRHRIDALLAAGAEQLQRFAIVHLRIV